MSEFTEFQRLSRDIANATATLQTREARYLVDLYYQMQDYRISSANQARSMGTDEPHAAIDFFAHQMSTFENQIKRVLDKWTDTQPLGEWAKSITGIGPVLAAGLLAHIDMAKAPTVGHIWSYAGLNPNAEWNKGEKRPWNASLKVVCWKIGESFVKVSANKNDVYGKVYIERKAYEVQRNDAVEAWNMNPGMTDNPMPPAGIEKNNWVKIEYNSKVVGWFRGGNAEAAAKALQKKIGKDTDAYKSYSVGKLPPAHIHARAKRYAVKLFLSHYWETGYRMHYGTEPPAPYAIEHLGHAHRIPAPV